MELLRPRLLIVPLLAVIVTQVASAQDNRCVTCHFERLSTGSPAVERAEQAHLNDWDTSVHAAMGIGCDACHGGNADSQGLALAHRDILSPDNPASPVYGRNVPETCGACHVGQMDAFLGSPHGQLLSSGDARAPSCMTCHGSVAARLPSTRGISSRCAMCHGPGGAAPRSDHHELVRLMRDRIQEHRYSLALVQTVIDYTADPDRRSALQTRYDEAVAPLADAVAAWHAFSFDEASRPLAEAGERIRELVEDVTAR